MCNINLVKEAIEILGDTPFGIIITDTSGVILHVNSKFERITGYKLADIIDKKIGKEDNILYSGAHDEDFYKNMWDTISAGDTYRSDLYNKSAAGDLYWQNITIKPYTNEKGETINYIGYIVNVDKYIKQKTAIENISKSIPGLIYTYDLMKRKSQLINDRYLIRLGYTAEELIELSPNLVKLVHDDDLDKFRKLNKKLRTSTNGNIYEIKFRVKSKDGSWRWFYSKETVMARNEFGTPIELIGVAIDVTEEVDAVEALDKLNMAVAKLTNTHIQVQRNLEELKENLDG